MLATLLDTVPSGLKARRFTKKIRQRQADGYGMAELDNCFVRYRTAGSGTLTVVMAADPPVTLECYDQLIEVLAKDYRVIVFEVPGFGFSLPKIGFDFSFDAVVNTLSGLLDYWQSAPYILAFPCASAYFSIALAERHPQLISHLAMIQAPNWEQEQQWKHRLDPKSILNTPIVGQVFLGSLKRKIARQWMQFASNTDAFTSLSKSLIDTQLHQGGCYCLASALQKSLTPESPKFETIKQPTILVYGEQDRSHKKTDFNSIRDYGSSIKTHMFANAGHFPELEAPELFKQSLDELV